MQVRLRGCGKWGANLRRAVLVVRFIQFEGAE
jgi:hypothetical protein